jgi:hypothetical protein
MVRIVCRGVSAIKGVHCMNREVISKSTPKFGNCIQLMYLPLLFVQELQAGFVKTELMQKYV